jgi:hypothetical protein
MSSTASDRECRRWVRDHVAALLATLGVAAGLIIADAKVSELIGAELMPGFRSILLLSVLLAGLGARAVLAWRSGTVDLQGRIFLVVVGLALLTGAAFGLSDCFQEVNEHYNRDRQSRFRSSGQTAPRVGSTVERPRETLS